MELYESKIDPKEQKFSITLDSSQQRPSLIEFKPNIPDPETHSSQGKSLKIKVVDMGGHHEYYTSSSLFVAGNGLFLVCFDSSQIQPEVSQSEYYAKVGSYVDLVSQVTAKIGVQPKMALVATKVEGQQNLKQPFSRILHMAKNHLKSLIVDSFIADEVFETSSMHVTKEKLEEICQKVFALCINPLLAKKPLELMPDSWFELLEVMKADTSMTLEKIETLFDDIKTKQREPQHKMDILKKFKATLEFIVENEEDMNKKQTPRQEHKKTKDGSTAEAPKVNIVQKTTNQRAPAMKDPNTARASSSWISQCCFALPFLKRANLEHTKSASSVAENITMNLTEKKPAEDTPGEALDPELRIALRYFLAQGEILWFEDSVQLQKTVLTQPMDFVKALRSVISHKFVQNFGGVQLRESKRELLHKGLLYFKDFESLLKADNQVFSETEVWHFLIQLNLASDLGDCLLLPCLITDSMAEKVRSKERELSKRPEAVTFQYLFDHNSHSSIGKYNETISLFTKHFVLGEKGGNISSAFSQKIEQRQLGIVGGVQGVLTWLNEGVQDPDELEFQILEYETSFEDPDENEVNNEKCYAVHRAIRIVLSPVEKSSSKVLFEIAKKFDELISEDIGEVHRSLICKESQLPARGSPREAILAISLTSPSSSKCCRRRDLFRRSTLRLASFWDNPVRDSTEVNSPVLAVILSSRG